MKTPRRLVAASLGALALSVATVATVATAGPAAAAPNPFSTDMISGAIEVDGLVTATFLTPGSSIPTCPAGVTGISGSVDDASTTNNMSASVSINTPFDDPLSSNDYALVASGSTSTNGNYNNATDLFDSLSIPVAFTIRNYNRATCTVGTVACGGNITLSASGGPQSGTFLPFSTGDQVYVNAGGTIDVTTSGCPGAIGLVVRDGATLDLGDNPNDDIPPNPPTPDLGAVFEQL